MHLKTDIYFDESAHSPIFCLPIFSLIQQLAQQIAIFYSCNIIIIMLVVLATIYACISSSAIVASNVYTYDVKHSI